ncbi:MAG: EAL domain-containing protein [Betaproteobacteria bacterium]
MNKPLSRQQELERLTRALRTLSGSNQALLRSHDETSLLQEICHVVVDKGGYRAALVGRAEHDEARSITLLAQVNRELELEPAEGLSWAEEEQGHASLGTAIRTGVPCLVNDVAAATFPAPWREFARRRGFGSLLALPLRVEGEVFGALCIAAPEPDAFDEPERRLLAEAADDLAFGLETLRGRQRRRHAEQEILRLNRALRARSAVNQTLAHATDEASLLGEICRVAVEQCGYRLAWVGFAEHDEDRTLRPVAYAGFDDGFLALPRSWGAREDQRITQVFEHGRPWVVQNVLDDAAYPFREQARARGYASMIALPLEVEGRRIGSLHMLAAEPDAFDAHETELLMATAGDLGWGLGALRARLRAKAAEETIRRLAFYDAVTGLPNRARLRDLLAEAIVAAKGERRPLALLRIEIERFREIDETLGEREVDAMLREVAARLERAVGDACRLARIAEGEFAVVLPRGGAEPALQLAQRLLAVLAEPIDRDGLLLDARSNIGISLFPGHGSEPEALLRRASIALGQARQAGGGVSVFRGGLDRERARRLSLMSDLRAAIERDELVLYCQPKLQFASGRLCGAEALVRWQHPRLGLLHPGEFIALAEHTGLITPLTYWVLDAALRQSYAWREAGVEQPLSVNLSARDLRDPKLLERIGGSLATWGAQPSWIEFELTESALMLDPAGALETLTRLRRLDLGLAIDDYGTGYSSLAYLQRLPVDTIKIDQSFVAAMAANADSATIVRSTIELAHNLDLAVVAEGVEDRGTYDRLAALGCDMAQGYCIARPVPADQFRGWPAAPH